MARRSDTSLDSTHWPTTRPISEHVNDNYFFVLYRCFSKKSNVCFISFSSSQPNQLGPMNAIQLAMQFAEGPEGGDP